MNEAAKEKVNSPESALLAFLDAWRAKDWKAALKATQITWRVHSGNNADRLEDMFGVYELCQPYWIDSVRMVPGDCRAEIEFTVALDGVRSAQLKAQVVCEARPYMPRPAGEWGVNPISLLRGLGSEGQTRAAKEAVKLLRDLARGRHGKRRRR